MGRVINVPVYQTREGKAMTAEAITSTSMTDLGTAPAEPASLAPIQTNAEQIERLALDAHAYLMSQRDDGDENTAFCDETHKYLMSQLESIRKALRLRYSDSDCIALAMADRAQDWRRPSWGIPPDVDDRDAKSWWICKLAGIDMPAKRRVTMSEVMEDLATDEEFEMANQYRSIMNRFQDMASKGKALLGYETTAKAQVRVVKKGKGKGKGKAGDVVINAATAKRYAVALVAYGRHAGRAALADALDVLLSYLLEPAAAPAASDSQTPPRAAAAA